MYGINRNLVVKRKDMKPQKAYEQLIPLERDVTPAGVYLYGSTTDDLMLPYDMQNEQSQRYMRDPFARNFRDKKMPEYVHTVNGPMRVRRNVTEDQDVEYIVKLSRMLQI